METDAQLWTQSFVASLNLPDPVVSTTTSVQVASDALRNTAHVLYDVTQNSNVAPLQPQTDLNDAPPEWAQLSEHSFLNSHSSNMQFTTAPYSRSRSWSDSTVTQECGSASLIDSYQRDVDFMGSSADFKRLFKMPYMAKQTALALYKLGPTIFLEDLSRYQYQQRKQAESSTSTTTAAASSSSSSSSSTTTSSSSSNPNALILPPLKRNPSNIVRQQLYSKFLAMSLPTASAQALTTTSRQVAAAESNLLFHPSSGSSSSSGGSSGSSSSGGSSNCTHQFARTFVWQLRDYSALVGSDLIVSINPLSAKPQPTKASIHLRDSTHPITALTWMDYWLDNCLNNVSELLLCSHHRGVVQGYETINTSDLPDRFQSIGSASAVEGYVGSVLEFLKLNCKRDFGVYVVACADKETRNQNMELFDFTDHLKGLPVFEHVINLSYRMALKLSHSQQVEDLKLSQQLLSKCVELLHEDEQPELCASLHAHIASLIVKSTEGHTGPIWGTAEGRYSLTSQQNSEKKFITAALHLNRALALIESQWKANPSQVDKLLHKYRQVQLQLADIHLFLAQIYMSQDRLSAALRRLLNCSFALHDSVRVFASASIPRERSAVVFSMYADIFFRLSQLHPQAIDTSEFEEVFDAARSILKNKLDRIQSLGCLSHNAHAQLLQLNVSVKNTSYDNLQMASNYYIRALHCIEVDTQLQPQRELLRRKLGSVQCELGHSLMQQGRTTRAAEYFSQALESFKLVDDAVMMALLYCNIAQTHRVHALRDPDALHRFEPHARVIDDYEKAKQVLGNRNRDPKTWDRAVGEQATAYYSFAVQMLEDHKEQLSLQAEETITHYLNQAIVVFKQRQDLPLLMSAYLRLAQLYSRQMKSCLQSPLQLKSRATTLFKLARVTYERALAECFPTALNQYSANVKPSVVTPVQLKQFVTVHIHLSRLHEDMPSNARFKPLMAGLDVLLRLAPLVPRIADQTDLASSLQTRLQQLLLECVRAATKNTHVKNMYRATLTETDVGSLYQQLQALRSKF